MESEDQFTAPNQGVVWMRLRAKDTPGKRRYKVWFIEEGDPKIRHVDYVWAHLASEAEQMIRNRLKGRNRKIVRIEAGVLG
jgi:hypothetical protein